MAIKFTQYMRPDGKQREVFINMPEETEALATEITKAGYIFTIEELTTGMISMTVEKPGDEEPIGWQLCDNGPAVPISVGILVDLAYEAILEVNNESDIDDE